MTIAVEQRPVGRNDWCARIRKSDGSEGSVPLSSFAKVSRIAPGCLPRQAHG